MFDAFLATSLFSGADLGWGKRVDWVVSHPPPFGGAKKKKLKKILNVIAAIKANALDGYLFVISTLWHC